MKSKGKVVVPIVLAAAVLVITGVVIYQHPLPGMEGWFPAPEEEPVVASQPVNEQPAVGSQVDSNAQESQKNSEVESSAAPASSLTIEDTYRMDPEKIYQFEQPFQVWTLECPVEFTVHNAALSKDLQGNDKSIFVYLPPDESFPEENVITDGQGNILSPHFYLFIAMTVENTADIPTEVCLSATRVIPIEKEGTMYEFDSTGSASEIRYISANKDRFGSDDYGFLPLEPYEKKEIVVGYTAYEPKLQKARLFLQFNIRGEGHGEGGNIYFHPVVDLKLP